MGLELLQFVHACQSGERFECDSASPSFVCNTLQVETGCGDSVYDEAGKPHVLRECCHVVVQAMYCLLDEVAQFVQVVQYSLVR